MSGWNFAEVWELVAGQVPDAPAQVHGDQRVTWADFDRRADGVARKLLDDGAQEQDKVAQYLYNGPEYLESVFAAFKAGLVPINTNYRYADNELVYLWDNADAVAVVFHGTFVDTIERIRVARPPGQDVAVGRRRQRPLPRVGHPLRGRRRPRPSPACTPWRRGAAAATTCS